MRSQRPWGKRLPSATARKETGCTQSSPAKSCPLTTLGTSSKPPNQAFELFLYPLANKWPKPKPPICLRIGARPASGRTRDVSAAGSGTEGLGKDQGRLKKILERKEPQLLREGFETSALWEEVLLLTEKSPATALCIIPASLSRY